MTQKQRRGFWILLGLLPLLVGCAGPTSFLDPEADLLYYEKVAVIPFTALAGDRAAGLRATNLFVSQLLQRQFAQVAEPGQFQAAMTRIRGGTPAQNPWSTADLFRLGDEAGVQGVFLGTVLDYQVQRSGRKSTLVVSIEARLVDVASGRIVWSSSITRRGSSGLPLIGWGRDHTLEELAAEVCEDLLGTLPGGGR